MKADISIPDPIYQAAEQLAHTLGVSLGELHTAALTAYVIAHQRGGVTEALNRVYDTEPSTMEPGLVSIQLVSVGGGPW